MSVIKSKRSTSDMEFLATARKLEIYTIQKCVNFPEAIHLLCITAFGRCGDAHL